MHLKKTLRCGAIAAALTALLLALAACSKKEAVAVETRMAAEPASPVMADMAAAPSVSPPPPPEPSASLSAASTARQMGSSAATYIDGDRKFIRTAQARFQVKDVYVAALGIEDTVASHGGFVVRNEIGAERISTQQHPGSDNKLIELSEYAVQGMLVVRVPSERTQAFLRAIVGHVLFLDQRHFHARDAQFDLLRQQLDLLRNQETQGELGQALSDGGKLQQKTDAIASRNEAKAGRDAALIAKKEFDDQVAFSTIELRLYQPSRVVQSERVDVDGAYRQARPGFLQRLGQQLRGGWDGLLDWTLSLAGAWPAVLLAGVAGTLLWRLRQRRQGQARVVESPPAGT